MTQLIFPQRPYKHAYHGTDPIKLDLDNTKKESISLFADDCVLYRNIKSLTDCQILQDGMNSLAQWEAIGK